MCELIALGRMHSIYSGWGFGKDYRAAVAFCIPDQPADGAACAGPRLSDAARRSPALLLREPQMRWEMAAT